MTIKLYGLFLILLHTLPLIAKGPAGIVLYSIYESETFLLLADETDRRGWCGFGGGDEKGENVVETAAREVEEETRRFFKKEWLKEQIKNQKPLVYNGYSMFFLEIPFISAEKIQSFDLRENESMVTSEKVNFAWVPCSELKEAIETNSLQSPAIKNIETSQTKFYWDIWFNGIKEAFQNDSLPFS